MRRRREPGDRGGGSRRRCVCPNPAARSVARPAFVALRELRVEGFFV